MEESLKFNSAICTTKEQSQRLLDLGLKPETADMNYMAKTHWGDDWFIPESERLYHLGFHYNEKMKYQYGGRVTVIPAWSLHRLLLLCDVTTMFTRDILETAYDDQINAIENLIKDGYFNKEYLKQ